ncbi:MAG: class I SAM-dependent methyltransferase [Gracilimonas sp.]|uniref:O-methyltransferase n=1 Tax=Gracilimonas sp. TaxID=1974203 RepID=UPI0037539A15|nr:class I SAM-dependent methyltransferase [Gracilimonas sp.]
MKKHRQNPIVQITDQRIEEYSLRMTTDESERIKDLVASSGSELDYIDMLSGNLVGQILKMLIKISGAKRILEVGTFTGYSAVMMAEALPVDGEVITIEMNILYQELAERHFKKFDTENKITLMKGNAQELIEDIEGYFDLIFLDADKVSYYFYYEQALKKIESGGLVVVDNVLWDGTVLAPADHKAKAVDQFNKKVKEDERVEQVLLPVRDGLTIIRKV